MFTKRGFKSEIYVQARLSAQTARAINFILIKPSANSPSGVVPITKKRLVYLTHPDKNDVFPGYGLPLENRYHLVGLLMIERPYRADDEWLPRAKEEFGDFHISYMAPSGERGIACNMKIEKESRKFLKEMGHPMSERIAKKLYPLLKYRPNPGFRMRWDDHTRAWVSEFDMESGEYGKKSRYRR